MSPGKLVDVAIVGRGPVGFAAALQLDRLGYEVALIGPSSPVRDERTSALLGASIELLERIDIWASIEPHAAPMRSLRIVDATGRLIRAPEVLFHASEIGRDVFGYNIPNAGLVAALESAGRERRIVQREAMLTEADANDGAVDLSLSDGTKLTAKLLVAADGRNSMSRKSAGIAIREWRYDQAALVLNLRHTRPHDDTSTEFHTQDGPFTLVPLPGNRSSLVWVGKPEESRLRAGLSDSDLAREIERQANAILGQMDVDGPRQVFPLSGMTAERFAANRTVLTGEAAHVFPPIGAQGLNLGYRDVAELARLLEMAPSDPGAADRLDAYNNARRGDVFMRTTAVDALNRSLLSAFLPVQGVRSLGLFLLDRVAPLRRAVMRRILAPS